MRFESFFAAFLCFHLLLLTLIAVLVSWDNPFLFGLPPWVRAIADFGLAAVMCRFIWRGCNAS